ncbi:MAG: secretion protein HlyD [Gammaproteobacteria bacterium]|nr:secretion protein HlyD [Gammaproteobacteria bacterium]
MRPKKPLVLGAIVAIAAIATAAYLQLAGREATTPLTLYGNVDIREVELAFRVPGRLDEMLYQEGEEVTAGETLARLDPEPYRDALAVAEAGVRQAEANLDLRRTGSRPQEVQRARAAVRAAEAAYRAAERDFERQQGLYESGASSQRVLEAAVALRDETAARLASAREALALSEEGFRAEEIAAAEADLAAAKARRDQARTQLEDTELVAPSPGMLLARVREPGSMLAQGAPVYTLSLRDPVYVRAYVDQPHLGKVPPGTTVTVTTDSVDKIFSGRVGFVSPRAEFTPKSVETAELRTDLVYRLRITVDDADESLLQGMPVTVHVPLADGSR